MKYKIAGLITYVCVSAAVLMISLAASDNKSERYIEHIMAEEKQPCSNTHSNDVICSHLPLIKINTNGAEIPGRPIYDTREVITGYTTAQDGNTTIPAQIDVVDNKGLYNHPDDTAEISSSIDIRIRGNSSRSFDKPNYFIRLVNADGTNNPQQMLGMDAHHEWALHGPYLDKSLIRNYMWYNIAGEIMEYSPNVRFCEVIVNGKYQGLYLLTETITAGKEGARLGLEVSKKDNSFSGYIVRLDRPDPEKYQAITPFTKYALRTVMQHEIAYPGTSNLTDTLKENIKDDFSFFEKALYSYDFDNPDYGYETFIDVDSFVDYFLINEFTCNYDAGWLSTYMYKDVDGKYKMCVWDFNSACDYYQDAIMPSTHFEMQNCLWYVMLIKDEDFTDKIVKRYYELRKTVLSDEYLYNFIDETAKYLGPAIERNYSVWGYTLTREYDMLSPPERNPESYDDAIVQIKDFLRRRTAWMDENIECITQYSAESRIKKFNENAN